MITLTDTASTHIQNFTNNHHMKDTIRLGVKTYGCNGMAYTLEFIDNINEEDITFIDNDITVVVDPKSLIYVTGVEMDYVREGLNEGFKFNNPNTTSECGCGESFNI